MLGSEHRDRGTAIWTGYRESVVVVVFHYITDENDQILEGDRQYKYQTKFNTDLIYVQDVEMINSCEIKEGNILKTKKADRSQHGIGTANMRDIVKQNGGEITWHYEEGKMHVTISFLI